MTHPLRTSQALREAIENSGASEHLCALASKGASDIELLHACIEPDGIDDLAAAKAVADHLGLNFVSLDNFAVSEKLFKKCPAARAYQFHIAPYDLDANTITIATANPLDLHLVRKLESLTGLSVRLAVSTRSAIDACLARSQGTSAVLKDVSKDFEPLIIKERDDGGEEIVSLKDAIGVDAPVIRFVNTLLRAALQKRASDIHIETYATGVIVKNRIDGVLYPATEILDPSHQSSLISRLKVMAELDIAEKRVPQDGKFRLRTESGDVDCRLSVLPSVYGEDVVIRILDKSSITDGQRDLSIERIGLDSSVTKRMRRVIREPYGMVLITGPTGSGKTTTLYAALSELNSGEEKIITIEDPVEYDLSGIVQIPVNENKGLTFAKGLRAILRHDPDKIMVGEIRDTDTAQIAVQSALTGHLVFTTVHANNAFDVISRFSHMGVDVYSFVSALNCVIAQRLVRRLCPHCATTIRYSKEQLEMTGGDLLRYQAQEWKEPKGCERCGFTGYFGREAVAEFLALSPQIREMILERRSTAELQATAYAEGMISLRESAIQKALDGRTSLHEVSRVTFAADD